MKTTNNKRFRARSTSPGGMKAKNNKRSLGRSYSPPSKRVKIHQQPPTSFVFSEVSAREKQQEKHLEDYIEKLDGYSTFDKSMGVNGYTAKFRITNLPADPESLILGTINFCIDEARKETIKNGVKPHQISLAMYSPLLNPHIYLNMRDYTENIADVFYNEIFKVAQSKQQQEISLFGEPFTIKIYNFNPTVLPTTRQIIGGKRKSTVKPIRHMINEDALIKVYNTGDHYCLFYALQAVFMASTLNNANYLNKYFDEKRPRKWRKDTLRLMANARIPENENEYDAVKYVPNIVNYWNAKYEGQFRFKVYIFGTIGHYRPQFKYGPANPTHELIILHDKENKHFHGVRTTYSLFHKPYCLSCESTYNNKYDHTINCRVRCRLCSKMDPSLPCQQDDDGFYFDCPGCKKEFRNQACCQHHHKTHFCEKSHQCKNCGVIYDVETNCRDGRTGHVCGESWCFKCQTWHEKDRSCYITPLMPPKNNPYRLVFFDFETTQNHPVDIHTPNNKQFEHRVNFVGAKVVCPKCIKDGIWKNNMKGQMECNICGDNRTVTFGHRPFSETEVDKHHETSDPLETFINWLLHELPIKYDTHAFAHNGGRFDVVLLSRELNKRKINPEVIRNGNKLYELRVEEKMPTDKGEKGNPTTVFWDSFNLLSRPLGDLVPMFELDIKEKPFFPHFFNKTENYGKKLTTLPPKEDYLYKGFKPDKIREFEEWYEEHFNDGFYLDEALPSYCMNDVHILSAACISFRGYFIELTKRELKREGFQEKYSEPHEGIDPLRETKTIASSSMKNFRLNYLPEKHLARVTDRGYIGKNGQSTKGMKFLTWYAEVNNVELQHEHSTGGEKKIGRKSVDGFIEAENKVIEFYGCEHHGCPRCYPDDQHKMITGKTAGKHRDDDKKREAYIRGQGYQLEVYWACQVDEMLEKDEKMREMFDTYRDRGPIDIRKAFYGGRTGPLKLFHQPNQQEEINYYDVTSLYPYTNMMLDEVIRGYPVGIPVEYTPKPYEVVHWTKPEDNPYPLALLKVFVIPPRKINVPVLPMKIGRDDDERLLFPLCSTCALKNKKGLVKENYQCRHTDEERGWVSECTSVELDEALRRGYIVKELISVLEYQKEDRELFRGYMRDCLAGKIHATGFDPDIKGNYEAEEKFIHDNKEMFGIEIDREKMKPNRGLRETEKFRANTLWGRFGLRNYGLAQTLITDDPCDLRELWDNPRIKITTLDRINDNGVMMITYMEKKEWTDAHESANVIIALWTTSCARLHLLKWMQKVVDTPGCELLYTDTDSVIFVHPKGKNPLQTSPYLGGLTDEYPKHTILEFCSGGSKQYGLKLQSKNNPMADLDYVTKIRGQTLSEAVLDQGLHYEKFKEMVLQYVKTRKAPEIPILYPNILRSDFKKGIVISTPLIKIYKPFIVKGIVRPSDFKVLDFGYTN